MITLLKRQEENMESVVVNANNLRNGAFFIYQGQLFEVLEYQHVKPGKGGAFMKLKVKNLKGGEIVSLTLRSEEKISQVKTSETPVQFLYRRGNSFYFMDLETFEEYMLDEKRVDEKVQFMKEGDTATLLKSGEEIIGLSLPNFVELRVESAPPGVKGDTASGGTKPAVLETGLTVQVPLFIQPGEVVRIDARTGEYVERVKK